jgi:integrating conjugative element protein (TIGR03749 family)
MVQEIEGGQIYLFDISASKKPGQNHPIQVFVQEASEPGDFIDSGVVASNISYVTLTRFAARQLYAPARLLMDSPGIVRTPLARDSINLMRGGAIDAIPLVAWRAGGYYVTAVKLTNRTAQPQTLDPRNLRGAWLTATFQHHRLLPAGNEADTTAVYLISARPFSVSF